MIDLAILGGGACGLSAAHFAQKRGLSVHVFEQQAEVGGKIKTVADVLPDGTPISIEAGPIGWLDHEPLCQQLCEDLNLDIVRSKASDESRFVLHNNSIAPLPLSPSTFCKTSLLNLKAKFRFLAEPLAPLTDNQNESVWEFASRRFGADFAQIFTQAIVAGLFAADPKTTGMRAMFPQVVKTEEQEGQITRGMRRFARRLRETGGTPVCTLPQGLSEWPNAIARSLGNKLSCNSKISHIQYIQNAWHLYEDRTLLAKSKHLLLAIPASAAQPYLSGLSTSLSQLAESTQQKDLTIITALLADALPPHFDHSFGIVGSTSPHTPFHSIQFLHNIFPHQVPAAKHCIRIMTSTPNNALDSALQAIGSNAPPAAVFQNTTPGGVPHYTTSHNDLLRKIEAELAAWPGLFLGGDSYYGIGLNAAVRHAEKVIRRIVT